MLSICIPHYNFANPFLFENLFSQCKKTGISFEILIVDDASLAQNKTYLKNFNQPEYKIHFLERNIGRSAIRNLLVAKAQYPYLLFLDADAEIIHNDFIATYLEKLGECIVSGGRIYSSNKPQPNFFLHHKYGSKVEQHASDQFQSNNFLIPKSIFSFLAFDEKIKGYGYEDVLFGLGAKHLGIELKKINNPVKHIQLKTNEEFIMDMEQALRNLQELIEKKEDRKLEKEVSVSALYQKLKTYRIAFLLSIAQNKILKNVKGFMLKNPSIGTIKLIAIYKLYYFHSLQKP